MGHNKCYILQLENQRDEMREVQFLAKTCAGELFFSLTSMGKFWGQSVLVKWFFYLTFSDFQKLGIITFRKQSISKIEVIEKCQKKNILIN